MPKPNLRLADPVGPVRHDPRDFEVLADLDGVRAVVAFKSGHLILADVDGAGDALQLGPTVLLAEAYDLARGIALSGGNPKQVPLALYIMAVALLAAMDGVVTEARAGDAAPVAS